jgi:hypothetical protein
MEKKKQRFVVEYLWMKGEGSKTASEELINTLGDNAYGPSLIKIELQKSRNGR